MGLLGDGNRSYRRAQSRPGARPGRFVRLWRADESSAQPRKQLARGRARLGVEPDLVAEVISPNETVEDVRLKLRDYQAIKTRLVLLVYSITKETEVHMLDDTARVYREGDTLEFPEVLPGFRLEVAKLFTR
ncbi:MAG: hypothetical protein C4331_02720 [Meiothermus sp.]